MEKDAMVQISFRVPPGLIERLDGWAERRSQEVPGRTVARADVMRELLSEALDRLDEESKPKPRRKRG